MGTMKDTFKLIELQNQLLDLYMNQIADLTMMSKIELGNDVIEEIIRLKTEIQRYDSTGIN
jgi:hypothetical protein